MLWVASQVWGVKEWGQEGTETPPQEEAATASATCTGKERREVPSALYHLGVSAWGHEEPPGAQPGRGGR